MSIFLFNVLERRNYKDKLFSFSFRGESVKKIVYCLKTTNFIILSSYTVLLCGSYQRQRLGWCIKLILGAQWILYTEMCHMCQFPIEYNLFSLCPLCLSDCKIFLMHTDSLFAHLGFQTVILLPSDRCLSLLTHCQSDKLVPQLIPGLLLYMMAFLGDETLFPWTADFLDNKGQKKTQTVVDTQSSPMFSLVFIPWENMYKEGYEKKLYK